MTEGICRDQIHAAAQAGLALLSPLVMLCGAFILSGSTPAGADTTTFSSSTVGTSGTTPDFTESGPWSMSWEYDCSGSQGYFLVGINQPDDDPKC